MRKYSVLVAVVFLLLGFTTTSQANFIVNGDFDSPLSVGWITSGDVDRENTLGSPMSGYYAVLGSDTSSGASFLRQSFAIPVGVDQLAVSFSYTFAGSDTAPFQADTALAALKQSFWFFSTANELLEASSPGDYSSGTYYGVVNVANWFGIDATTGELIFSLYESSPWLGSTNSLFAVDNVSVAAVPEPSTMLLLGLGLVGFAAARRRK
jgi:hypothetical protein